MKKKVMLTVLLVVLSLLLPLAFAQNLYQQDSLELELDVSGSFDLVSQSSSAEAKEVTTELFLSPQESFRQKILGLTTVGEVKDDRVLFTWKNPSLARQEYGYTAKVKTLNEQLSVNKKVSFPLKTIEGYEQYTRPTGKIDSDHPAIVAKARELAEGEDDLFKVTFNLAYWVSENVDYDLNDLTTDVAQKASWVLQNKQGVCDEMTSLFVAMARSLGIPARFVSGISYTEDGEVLQALGKNWASHGWAEVYFPDIGWVSFDITFDEYGYIDVTHIKLREGFDPDEPATKFSWLAEHVDLKANSLDVDVRVLDKGTFQQEKLSIKGESLAEKIDFGSYNLIKAVVHNTANTYAATTLNLAVPKEIEILGKNKRKLLLTPQEIRETYWIVKIQDGLDSSYHYTFPVVIYSEKNVTAETQFIVQSGESSYTKQEIEDLSVQDEEKSYSQNIKFDCQYAQNIEPGVEVPISCTVKNQGDQDLTSLRFCLDDVCETITLKAGGERSQQITVIEQEPGWHNIVASVENAQVEKKTALSFTVSDVPNVELQIQHPEEIAFGENIPLEISIGKLSFSSPKNVVVIVRGLGVEQRWQIDELSNSQDVKTTFPGDRLSFKNTLTTTTTWQDASGESYTDEQKVTIKGQGSKLSDTLKMALNMVWTVFG